VAVDLQQVSGGADQLPFTVDLVQPSSGESAVALVVFDLSEDRLDGDLAFGLACGVVGFGKGGVHAARTIAGSRPKRRYSIGG